MDLPQTRWHHRPDYCLCCLSAGPLKQPIGSRKRCNTGHVKVGRGQGLRGTLLTDKRDWCKLTKLEPYWVSAAVPPAPQGTWGDQRHSFNPPIPLRCFFWLPPTCIHLNLSYIPAPSYLIRPSNVMGTEGLRKRRTLTYILLLPAVNSCRGACGITICMSIGQSRAWVYCVRVR